MNLHSKIFLAGHTGLVGSSILRNLEKNGYSNFVFAPQSQIDLTNQKAVQDFFRKEKPEIVILAAARVGGINANIQYPADFLYENLMIQNNIIHQSSENKVEKLLFLGSSCIYPKECPQPMKEEYLLSGKLEPTNEGYALAKISGLKMCEYYKKQYGLNSISLMPCNIYGPNDSFNLQHSHVLSALVKKYVDAADDNSESVTNWGSGIARREFLHVDDLAEAVLYMLKNYDSGDFINIGSGSDISIKELAGIISEKAGYKGETLWDLSKPDGMLKKCLDITKMLQLGFKPGISLNRGIDQMLEIYIKQKKESL